MRKDVKEKVPRMTLDRFAIIVGKSFHALERDIANFKSEFHTEIKRLDDKIDYRFDTLSNRIDVLVSNQVTRDEHLMLAKRVKTLERAH